MERIFSAVTKAQGPERTALLADVQQASIQMLRSTTEAMMQRRPWVGALHAQVRDACLGYGGADVPLSRAIGLATTGPATESAVLEIERFYRERQCATQFSISPRTHGSLTDMLAARGYQATGRMTNWCRAFEHPLLLPAPAADIEVVQLGAEDSELWVRTVVAGFEEQDSYVDPAQLSAPMLDMFHCLGFADGATAFLARRGKEALGGAALHVCDGTAFLRTCSTRLGARRSGVQAALAIARLRVAAALGCSLAFSSTEGYYQSARNLVRFGFAPLSESYLMWKN